MTNDDLDAGDGLYYSQGVPTNIYGMQQVFYKAFPKSSEEYNTIVIAFKTNDYIQRGTALYTMTTSNSISGTKYPTNGNRYLHGTYDDDDDDNPFTTWIIIIIILIIAIVAAVTTMIYCCIKKSKPKNNTQVQCDNQRVQEQNITSSNYQYYPPQADQPNDKAPVDAYHQPQDIQNPYAVPNI